MRKRWGFERVLSVLRILIKQLGNKNKGSSKNGAKFRKRTRVRKKNQQ